MKKKEVVPWEICHRESTAGLLWCACGGGGSRGKGERLGMHRNKCVGSFNDMKDLIWGDVGEALRRFAARPGYLDVFDFRWRAQSRWADEGDCLQSWNHNLQCGRCDALGLAILYQHANACAEAGPVRLDSFEFEGDPMISGMPRILEERAGVSVPERRRP